MVPVYWKLLSDVPVFQVVSHRVLWSALFLTLFLVLSGQAPAMRAALRRPSVVATYAAAAGLIGINWCGFIWAVGAERIVETSLGYFINPLLSVLLAVFVVGERLRPAQWAAVALAASGVLYLSVAHGAVPWIAFLLAGSFALYGLVKKRAPLGSVQGLALETSLLVPPALAMVLWSDLGGQGVFLREGASTDLLLIGGGTITMAPLLMFASAARRIPLVWVGLLQYLAPSLQLLLGVFVYSEPFGFERLVGFSLVWAALALFAVEGLLAHRASVSLPLPE